MVATNHQHTTSPPLSATVAQIETYFLYFSISGVPSRTVSGRLPPPASALALRNAWYIGSLGSIRPAPGAADDPPGGARCGGFEGLTRDGTSGPAVASCSMVISSNRAPRRPVLGRDCLFLLVVPGSGRSVSSSNTSSSDSDSTSTMRLDMLDRADFGERVGGSVKGIGDEQEMQRQSPITPRVDVADKAKPCSNCRCQKTPPPLTLRHTMICNRSLTLTRQAERIFDSQKMS